MYFTGRLSIDPAQATVIERHELKGPFKKLLNFLTKEDITPEEEHETFSAICMLKDLREAFRKMGVTNLIRLAKNEVTFYMDEEGNETDLGPAVEDFSEALRPQENEEFDSLSLALEHKREGWHYLIEVHVEKSHGVGVYPLNIKVNAFPVMQFPDPVSEEWLQEQLRGICKEQAVFDAYWANGRARFTQFLSELDQQIKEQIEVTDSRQTVALRMVRPRGKVEGIDHLKELLVKGKESFFPEGFDPDPIFGEYPKFIPYLYGCTQWGGACHKEELICRQMEVVDGLGRLVMIIGESGLFAGATTTLDPAQPFVEAKGENIEYFESNAFFNEIDRLRLIK